MWAFLCRRRKDNGTIRTSYRRLALFHGSEGMCGVADGTTLFLRWFGNTFLSFFLPLVQRDCVTGF